MSETVAPPIHDPLDSELVPECEQVSDYDDLVAALMEAWDASKPDTERKMESYTLAQCEYLVRERWGVYDE